MRRIPVSSSAVKKVGYAPKRRLLEVEYRNGRLYHYYKIPPRVYNDFIHAESIGKYVNAHIKNSYSYCRVEDVNLS